MDADEIKEKIKQAEDIAKSASDPDLKKIAFKEVLREFLRGTSTRTIAEVVVEQPAMRQVPDHFSEFSSHYELDSHMEKVVGALYFNFHKGNISLTLQELGDAYSNARTKSPANFSDVLGACIRKGYVIEARDKKDGKKAWQITSTGEKYLETLKKVE